MNFVRCTCEFPSSHRNDDKLAIKSLRGMNEILSGKNASV